MSLLAQEEAKLAVKEAADIVEVIGQHVSLKRTGGSYSGLCPFHGEKTPSFSVHPQKQFFHCFGCGESGDVFSFVMKYHHLDFPEALQMLAKQYQIDLPERQLTKEEQARLELRELLYAVNELAADSYSDTLQDGRLGLPARQYLQQRQVPLEAVAQYRLGFAPHPGAVGWDFLLRALATKYTHETLEKAGLAALSNKGSYYDRFRSRILFPLQDMSGRVAAFGGRIIGEGMPKYMNSPETIIFDKSRLLFGLHPHRETIRAKKQAIVVEGNFDLLLLAVHGVKNVVAPLGTALTRQHLHALRGYCEEVVLLFDADAAGLKAAMRSIPFFLAEKIYGRVALLPKGHDPDSYVREQGAAAVEELVQSAEPLAEFALAHLIKLHGQTLDGKAKIVEELRPLLQEAQDPTQRELLVAHFCEKLGLSSASFGRQAAVRPRNANNGPQSAMPRHLAGLRSLSGQEKQLFDFVLFYPEHIGVLLEAGLIEVVSNQTIKRLLGLMEGQSLAGGLQPEHLLSADLDKGERDYVLSRLMEEHAMPNDEQTELAQDLLNRLLAWVGWKKGRFELERLQLDIEEAERAGDKVRVLELVTLKASKRATGVETSWLAEP